MRPSTETWEAFLWKSLTLLLLKAEGLKHQSKGDALLLKGMEGRPRVHGNIETNIPMWDP